MSAVAPVGREDFDAVYRAVLAADDPDLPREAWERLFAWGDPDEPRGWAILDGERIVGFLGAVIRRRPTPGGEATAFCNLHSWIVEPGYRGRSLLLLRAALAREDAVLTDFSPTPDVETIARRLGFRRLDARLRILPPAPGREDAAVDLDPASVAGRLGPDDARVLADHGGGPMRHAWVEDARGGCWVAWSVVDRYPVRHGLVHHLSDPAAFARASRTARRAILDAGGARFVAVPERLLGGARVGWSALLPVESRQLVRSAVPAGPVDTLYSEVAALGLATMPDLSDSATRGARKLLQWKGRTAPRSDRTAREDP